MSDIIKELSAFISVDKHGNEGIIAHCINGVWHPMICADQARIEQWRPIAIEIANHTKSTVKLIRLTTRTDLETIEPNTLNPALSRVRN
jgi:hypothetical protein